MSSMAYQITGVSVVYSLSRLFRRKSKKTPKLLVTCLCEGKSPVTGEFPAHRDSNVENNYIWWHHHDEILYHYNDPFYNMFGVAVAMVISEMHLNHV